VPQPRLGGRSIVCPPVGTCRMGTDPAAVTATRVADAKPA
jgi:hypothetical protein